MTVSTRIETITPEQARKYLEKNVSNRPVREGSVNKWAYAIKGGQWQMNGETIKFAADGTLIDGQHRLMAIVSTGISIQSIVVRGLEKNTYETIDTGSRRRSSDTLARNGEANSATLATAARYLYIHEQLGLFRISSKEANLVTTTDVLETIEANPDLRESVSKMRCARGLGSFMSSSMAAVLHYLFSKTSSDDANMFFTRLQKGNDLESDHPILRLRNRLIGIRDSGHQGRVEKMALTIKAFNLFRKRKSCASLRWIEGEEFPEIAR